MTAISKLPRAPRFCSSSCSLADFHRDRSYQLVFDVSDTEDDEEEVIMSRSSSCTNFNSLSSDVIKSSFFPVPLKSVPQTYKYLQKLLPLQQEFGLKSTSRSFPVEAPLQADQSFDRASGHAIKISHPAFQVGGFTGLIQPSMKPKSPPSFNFPTRDFITNGRRIPVYLENVESNTRESRSIPLFIR